MTSSGPALTDLAPASIAANRATAPISRFIFSGLQIFVILVPVVFFQPFANSAGLALMIQVALSACQLAPGSSWTFFGLDAKNMAFLRLIKSTLGAFLCEALLLVVDLSYSFF